MPYILMVYLHRKQEASPAAFQKYFEDNEVDVLRSIGGDDFPVSHARLYLKRSEEGNKEATLIRGEQSEFAYDALVLMEFRDKQHSDTFFNKTHEPNHLATYDHPLMPDRTKSKAVELGEIYRTTRLGTVKGQGLGFQLANAQH